MTTYILKDSYEQLIKRELTQMILFIIQNSYQKYLTKKEIYNIGKRKYGEKFRSDEMGHTLIRNLKTMKKFGLVEEKYCNGIPSKWRLKKISTILNYHIMINHQIKTLQLFSKELDLHYSTKSGLTIYGIDRVNIKKRSLKEKKLKKIIEGFNDTKKQLVKFINDEYSEKIFQEHQKVMKKIPLDKFNVFFSWIFIICLYHFEQNFFGYENEKGHYFVYKYFKKDEFPFVLKPDITLFKIIKSKLYPDLTNKAAWDKINGYIFDEETSISFQNMINYSINLIMTMATLTVVCQNTLNEQENIFDKELNLNQQIEQFNKNFN